jgi:hypothetical protein
MRSSRLLVACSVVSSIKSYKTCASFILKRDQCQTTRYGRAECQKQKRKKIEIEDENVTYHELIAPDAGIVIDLGPDERDLCGHGDEAIARRDDVIEGAQLTANQGVPKGNEFRENGA